MAENVTRFFGLRRKSKRYIRNGDGNGYVGGQVAGKAKNYDVDRYSEVQQFLVTGEGDGDAARRSAA